MTSAKVLDGLNAKQLEAATLCILVSRGYESNLAPTSEIVCMVTVSPLLSVLHNRRS